MRARVGLVALMGAASADSQLGGIVKDWNSLLGGYRYVDPAGWTTTNRVFSEKETLCWAADKVKSGDPQSPMRTSACFRPSQVRVKGFELMTLQKTPVTKIDVECKAMGRCVRSVVAAKDGVVTAEDVAYASAIMPPNLEARALQLGRSQFGR
jgi:hypothetical protein